MPASPDRYVLENVPWIGFYNGTMSPEETILYGCLRAVLEYRDETGLKDLRGDDTPWHNVYVYLLGVSGAAFRLVWDDDWDCAVTSALMMSEDPMEPVHRAFRAAGYAVKPLFRPAFAKKIGYQGAISDDESPFRNHIIASLRDRGLPVPAIGVVGPPECCLLTGYDENGAVMLGRSYFQTDPEFVDGLAVEESGNFRKRDWFADTHGLLLVGEPCERPSRRVILLEALQWALAVMRTPCIRGRASGHAAYRRWTEALLEDDTFPTNDLDTWKKRYLFHFLSALVVAEGRWYANGFLQMVGREIPEIADLMEEAAVRFRAEHDLMWAVWEFAGGNGVSDEHARKLADRQVRNRIVPLIHLSRQQDEMAADAIEQALQRLGAG